MTAETKPRVVLSACLGKRACRYNGEAIADDFVARLGPHVRFLPVCPEEEIGLGTPREPVRLVRAGDENRLVQPATGADVTSRMRSFAGRFLDGTEGVDGFLLKKRSPSCGILDARVYASAEKSSGLGKGPGMFGAAVLARFPHAAVEDEGRLRNFRIREHFLTKLFTRARFRAVPGHRTLGPLVRFHAAHKLLLLAYDEASMRRLGALVANPDRAPVSDVVERYGEGLGKALERMPRPSATANVLQHAYGHFKRGLSPREKKHFAGLLDRFRRGRLP